MSRQQGTEEESLSSRRRKEAGEHAVLLNDLPAVSKNDNLQQSLLLGRHFLYGFECRSDEQ